MKQRDIETLPKHRLPAKLAKDYADAYLKKCSKNEPNFNVYSIIFITVTILYYGSCSDDGSNRW